MLTRSMLNRLAMVAGIFGLGFLLVACDGSAPRVYYPEKLCSDSYMEPGSRGGPYRVCMKYDLKCPTPLVIEENADKSLICRLKKSEGN